MLAGFSISALLCGKKLKKIYKKGLFVCAKKVLQITSMTKSLSERTRVHMANNSKSNYVEGEDVFKIQWKPLVLRTHPGGGGGCSASKPVKIRRSTKTEVIEVFCGKDEKTRQERLLAENVDILSVKSGSDTGEDSHIADVTSLPLTAQVFATELHPLKTESDRSQDSDVEEAEVTKSLQTSEEEGDVTRSLQTSVEADEATQSLQTTDDFLAESFEEKEQQTEQYQTASSSLPKIPLVEDHSPCDVELWKPGEPQPAQFHAVPQAAAEVSPRPYQILVDVWAAQNDSPTSALAELEPMKAKCVLHGAGNILESQGKQIVSSHRNDEIVAEQSSMPRQSKGTLTAVVSKSSLKDKIVQHTLNVCSMKGVLPSFFSDTAQIKHAATEKRGKA